MSGKQMKRLRKAAGRIAAFQSSQSGKAIPKDGYDNVPINATSPSSQHGQVTTYNSTEIANFNKIKGTEIALNKLGSVRQIYRELKKIK